MISLEVNDNISINYDEIFNVITINLSETQSFIFDLSLIEFISIFKDFQKYNMSYTVFIFYTNLGKKEYKKLSMTWIDLETHKKIQAFINKCYVLSRNTIPKKIESF